MILDVHTLQNTCIFFNFCTMYALSHVVMFHYRFYIVLYLSIRCPSLRTYCTPKPHCKDTIPKNRAIIPRKGMRGLSPNSHIHLSVSDLYIPTIGLPIMLQENMLTDPENI
jgi:hypothetical protein